MTLTTLAHHIDEVWMEVAVRQPRQALEPLIAKDLVLTAHHPPRGRSTQPAQRLVDLGEQPDVNRGGNYSGKLSTARPARAI